MNQIKSAQTKLNQLFRHLTPKRIKVFSMFLAGAILLATTLAENSSAFALSNGKANNTHIVTGITPIVWPNSAAASQVDSVTEPNNTAQRLSKAVFDGIALTTESLLSNPNNMTVDPNAENADGTNDLSLRWLAQIYQYVITINIPEKNGVGQQIMSFAVGNNNAEAMRLAAAQQGIICLENNDQKGYDEINKTYPSSVTGLKLNWYQDYGKYKNINEAAAKTLAIARLQTIVDSLTTIEGEYITTAGNATFTLAGSQNTWSFARTFSAITRMGKLVAAFWMIGLAIYSYLQESQRENASKDLLYKLMLKIAVSSIIVAVSDYLVTAILILGNHAASYMVFSLQGLSLTGDSSAAQQSLVFDNWRQLCLRLGNVSYNTTDNLIEKVNDMPFKSNLEVTMSAVIPAATIIIIDVVTKFVLIQYVLELGIRRALFPFSLADIAQEGLRSRGVMWIKSLFAVFLKITVCAIVGALSRQIGVIMMASGSGAGHAFTFCINQAIVSFTCLGTLLKAGGYVDKLLGTQ